MVRIPLSLVLVEAALGAMLVVTCTTHSAPLDDLREQPRAPRV
ncbi:MAG: hypothetical protein JWM40_1997, partial [Frankiales bacterium]|nr:hypothetical protein [Frankiales bacterium]